MGFLSFWWESIQEAFRSAWGVIGGIDLVITILGAIAYDAIKLRGPGWLKNLLNHPALSDKWRLCAIFFGWFLLITLFLAPYWQCQKLAADNSILTNSDKGKDAQIKARPNPNCESCRR